MKNKMTHHYLAGFVFSACTFMLSACGGGSDSSTSGATTGTGTGVVNSVPGAPSITSATAGNASATISFSAPANNGGAAISSYAAACTAAGVSVNGAGTASPITVNGLTNGVTYTCAITATNSIGTGAASTGVLVAPAATVTPPSPGSFSVTSSAGSNGGNLPAEYTCDGSGATVPLAWSGAPTGTTEYAVLMTTLPGDGTTK